MKPVLTHVFDSHLDLDYGQTNLFRYVYQSDTPQAETPKPYFHPLRTLAGNIVTNFRPYDHPWHHGLAMTMAELSGQNFWGGGSYVHGQGYVNLPNNGNIVHQSWARVQCDDEAIHFDESLQWITYDKVLWLQEKRTIAVNEINEAEGYWTLEHTSDLKNVHTEPLVFGSPTTKGRPMAGYGSLFWRGPRSFLHGQILAGNNLTGPAVMGQAAPWLAYTGWHDGTQQQSTLLFIDDPSNLRYPTKWFVREDPFACVSCSFMFDEEYSLSPGENLTLTYRLVLANGAWSQEQIEAYCKV